LLTKWKETQLKEKSLRAAKPRIFIIQKTRQGTKHSHSHTRYAVVIPCTLTCTYTQTSSNQVSYLKGSSMKSFSLGLLSKLDFKGWSNHISTTLRKLTNSVFALTPSLSTKKLNTIFLNNTCLETSIYKL